MWSNISISFALLCGEEIMLGQRGQPILENLALALRHLAEHAGRDAGRAMESAHEVREVGKADVESDVGDGTAIVCQQSRSMPQARTHEILVRRDPDDFREQTQEM